MPVTLEISVAYRAHAIVFGHADIFLLRLYFKTVKSLYLLSGASDSIILRVLLRRKFNRLTPLAKNFMACILPLLMVLILLFFFFGAFCFLILLNTR